MSTPDAVIGRINKLPDAIRTGHAAALKASAEKARTVMQSAPGSVHSVSSRRIGVSARQINADTMSVKWGPSGWVRIVNDRTQPHFIARRGGGSLRGQNLTGGLGRKSHRGGAFLLRALGGQQIGTGMVHGAIGIPGVGPRAYAFHPGTKGKHFVEIGKRLAVPAAGDVYATKAMTEPMRSIFHG